MSEKSPSYQSDNEIDITADVLSRRRCALPKYHPDYLAPTNEEVRALRKLLGWPQARLGNFAGLAYNNKGCKAVRRWELPPSAKEHNAIDYCAWQMMLMAAGVITLEDRVEASEQYKEHL